MTMAEDIQWCPDISPGPVQPDNGTIRGVGHNTVLLPFKIAAPGPKILGVFGLNKFTFSNCSVLTVSVIIKGYLCGENALKVMIHYVL